MALKYHPDKNQVKGADEAFKMVGKAFAVLSDPSKRRQYDLSGSDPDSVPSRGANSFSFDGDINAEDLFNMFFNNMAQQRGGFYSFGGGQFSSHGHPMYRRTRQANRQTEDTGLFPIIMQYFPLLFLLFISLMSSFLFSPASNDSCLDHISLFETSKHSYARATERNAFPYFADRDFQRHFYNSKYSYSLGSQLRKCEDKIESVYIENLRRECNKETRDKQDRLNRAKYDGDKERIEKIKEEKLPSCEKLQGR